MSRLGRSCLTFITLLLGCESDGGDATAPSVDGSQATATIDASASPSAAEAAVPIPTPDASAQPGPQTSHEAGSIMLGGRDAGTSADTGTIMITIPTRSVMCGSSECTTTNNRTCCDSWSRMTGFSGKPECLSKASCESEHTNFGSDSNRVVESDCDEPSDCSGGQVCCFVRYGMPVTADLLSAEIVGPGASRLCLDISACNASMTSITGVAGIPVGVVACKTAADCKDGATCVAEMSNSVTSGKTNAARPGVMVCR